MRMLSLVNGDSVGTVLEIVCVSKSHGSTKRLDMWIFPWSEKWHGKIDLVIRRKIPSELVGIS